MYDSFINYKHYSGESPIFESYIKKAEACVNRPLSILAINSSNFNKYTNLIYGLVNYKDNWYSSYVDSNFHIYEPMDYDYVKSVHQFTQYHPEYLLTIYEFCYLYDLYCLEIGIEAYHKRCFEKEPITIQEILNSKFFKYLLNMVSEKRKAEIINEPKITINQVEVEKRKIQNEELNKQIKHDFEAWASHYINIYLNNLDNLNPKK